MATVEVTFTPLPAHVRTARLVATAVARRSGVDETLLDEVRLAVGEACSRAVRRESSIIQPASPTMPGTDRSNSRTSSDKPSPSATNPSVAKSCITLNTVPMLKK